MTEEGISPYLGDPASVDRDLLSGITTAAAGLVSRGLMRSTATSSAASTTSTASEASQPPAPALSTTSAGGTPIAYERRGLPGERPGPRRIRPAPVPSNGGIPPEGSEPNDHGQSSQHSFLFLGLIFLSSLIILFWVYRTFPNLEPGEKQHIKLPRNIQDAKMLGDVLNRYKEKYYWNVLCGTFIVYIFLQTFAIPGSIFLSILSGFLFPFYLALLLVCFCSATGASFCYGLSWLVGRRLIYKYFPEKVESWALTVNNHRDNIFNYIVFLRITPFLPNWFINITAPVIGVPIIPFFLGTFFGVAPPSFVAIQAGTTLHELSSSSDAISWTSLCILLGLGLMSLIPILMKDRLRSRFQ